MPSSVKEGDAKTLRWDLGRDLTAVTAARVIISLSADATPVLDRNGQVDSPASDGIVSLTLASGDYGPGGLEPGVYLVEIETTQPAGLLTHPDDGYERLTVVEDLG